MCRSIKVLRRPAPASEEEIAAAALQFIRKVSGFPKPSKTNKEAFDRAVTEIAGTTERLLRSVGCTVVAGAGVKESAVTATDADQSRTPAS